MAENPIDPDELGPTARDVHTITQSVLLGSDLNLEKMMDPDLEVSTDDRFRFLIGMIAGANAAILHTAQSVDVLREGMTEMLDRLKRLEGRL